MTEESTYSVEKADELLIYIDSLKSRLDLYWDVLEHQDAVPESTMDKLEQYREIVSKQHLLAVHLRGHILKHEWVEVCRHVQLIRGLAAMIRDDVKALLSGKIYISMGQRQQELLN
jgi:hypothetical protein